MRPLRCVAWLVTWLAWAGGWARGQEDAVVPSLPQRLTLAEGFGLALQHNKSIRASRLQAAAEHARIMQARGSFDPELFTEARWQEADEPISAN
jgi:outer membrane protein TolC